MNTAVMNPIQEQAPTAELVTELQQTLYREARLLDYEKYDEWVTMLTEDVHYHMPAIGTRYRRDPTDQVGDLTRMAYYNDSLDDLKRRLRRLATGTAWSEDPATRYVHLIGNVEVERTDDENEYKVYSTFYAYRSRNERDEDSLSGHREDIWRRTAQGLKLARRLILLRQNVLLSKNLNIYL